MPDYSTVSNHTIRRDSTILDTNVLIAAFRPEDERHDDSRTFIFELAPPMIVPVPVIVEAWGFLVGKLKRRDYGIEMLAWLSNPGNGVLLIDTHGSMTAIEQLINQLHIDCVDAYLVHLANDVSKSCDLNPPISIATYDTRDFVRCRLRSEFRLRVWDLRSLDFY